jgi:hypothetical protein
MSRIECRCIECNKVTEVFGSSWCAACYHPLKEHDRCTQVRLRVYGYDPLKVKDAIVKVNSVR